MPLRACLRVVLVASAFAAGCGSDDSSPGTAAKPQGDGTGAGQASTPASGAARKLHLAKVGTFSHPVAFGTAPGDTRRLYVVEQTGRIMVVRGGRKLSKPFLDLGGSIVSGGEQGLLGIAFAPDFQTSRHFYVDFTDKDGNTRIVEFTAKSADVADPSSRRDLLEIDQPESNHNGGQLAFGPDKLLYIGMGDGGGANDRHGSRGNGQNRDSLLGKILRIDPSPSGGRPYGIPSGNPFRGGGGRPEIYSYGLRNPWRFSFDRRTGALAIGDVGQGDREEIDYEKKGGARGRNYGWRVWEGTLHNYDSEEAPGSVKPDLEYSHDDGWCSIIGGFVVRDRALGSLYGRYVYGDYCLPDLYVATPKGGALTAGRRLGLKVSTLTSFGEDARGRIYAASESGPVYRLAR